MAAPEKLKQLVAQMPDPDRRGMLTTDIDKDRIEKAIAAMHAGGPEYVRGLIEMLGEPGSEEDAKPHYALHCLANHTLVAKDEAGRKALCGILAAELAGDRSIYIKSFLCQELGWAGRAESLPALGAALVDENLTAPAAMALAAIGAGAAEVFRAAWPKAKGAARRNIIDGLAASPDAAAADIFADALQDDDVEIRVAAAAGLAELGDARAAAVMLKAAAASEGWERFQFAKTCLVLAEKRLAAGDKSGASAIYESLQKSPGASTPHVRDAAERGLAAVAAA